MKNEYIIITPCKNEEKNIERTIISVVRQSLKPSIWIISNNNSTDKSKDIINKYAKKYKWIYLYENNNNYKNISHHETALYNAALKICKHKRIKFHYIANLDADIELDGEYYKRIITFLNNNDSHAIARGKLIHINNNQRILESNNRDTTSSGAISVYRKVFLEKIKEIPTVPYSGWDSLLVLKAIYHKYKTKTIEDTYAIHLRPLRSASGLWNGWKRNGKAAYYFRIPAIYMIGRSIKYTLSKKFIRGIAYLYGYLESMIKKEERLETKYSSIYKNILMRKI